MSRKGTENLQTELKKKGKKGLFRLLFSRMGLIMLLLLGNIALLAALVLRFRNFMTHYVSVATVLSVLMVLVLLNSRTNASVKVTWLVVVMVLPMFGVLLYFYTKSDVGHRALRDRSHQVTQQTRPQLHQSGAELRLQQEDAGAGALSRYLWRCGFPTYDGAAVTYFPSGEAKFEALLEQLELAREYIYLEYFIIDKGLVWSSVLEILKRKAAEGVDVRVLYDGTCEVARVPMGYAKQLEKLGIQCRAFAPLTPFLSTHYNYRDHRKIVVIDGHTAFTGGVNLADEYINRIDLFGHWKDTAIMVKGDAVQSFAWLFLQMWNITDTRTDFSAYPQRAPEPPENAQGYVIPYGDCPLDDDKVGERVYMDILNRSQQYVHLMTPYLILDGELEAALKFAAERGADVTLILPGIPDKKYAYALAKTHYASLLDSGVKIYEYVPGFVHAKVCVSDDCEAVVGTVNLDYRSLYHHFECAAYLYKTACISEIEADFQTTLKQCRRVTHQSIKKEKLSRRLTGFLLKAVAPLM